MLSGGFQLTWALHSHGPENSTGEHRCLQDNTSALHTGSGAPPAVRAGLAGENDDAVRALDAVDLPHHGGLGVRRHIGRDDLHRQRGAPGVGGATAPKLMTPGDMGKNRVRCLGKGKGSA